jgi:hypothetical protein
MLDWRNLRLCILAPLDASLTLSGQSAAYWQGERNEVNEFSPDLNRLLTVGPTAFLGGFLIWIAVFTTIVLLLPRRPAMVIAAAVAIGHTIGACTWIIWRPPYGYQVCIALTFLTALLLVSAFPWGESPSSAARNESPGVDSRSGLRWLLAGLLLAAVAFVFAVPH